MKLYYFENSKQSFDFTLLPYKIQRRRDVQEKQGKYYNCGVLEVRYSRLVGLRYIDIKICYYLYICIRLSNPI